MRHHPGPIADTHEACRRTAQLVMPPRHRFLEPIHNVKDGGKSPDPRPRPRNAGLHLWRKTGGASRDRTDDLKLAKLALSQLSYGPNPVEHDKHDTKEASALVGREGVEPSTSRLSGVRSNHLSYRPPMPSPAGQMAAGGVSQLRRTPPPMKAEKISRMKGHEDGGYVLWKVGSIPAARAGAFRHILRKEVIQPQVPLRLPCYDFTPVAEPTVVGCLPCGLAHHLRVNPTPMV